MTHNNDTDKKIDLIAGHINEILKLLGEDTAREGLLKTPRRAAKALWYITDGYRQDPGQLMRQAVFAHEGSQMVVVRNIEFYSMCEHHILPFFGHVSIGYVPDGKIVGLSKLARLVNLYARRLQVQERLTRQICHDITAELGAKGTIVMCHAEHLCMKMRGVETQDSKTTTIEYDGIFADDPGLRSQFLAMIKE